MDQLFAYGTLQDERVQIKLFGRVLDGTEDALAGYELGPIEITDSKFIALGESKDQSTATPSPNNMIRGTVYEVSSGELKLADEYEPAGFMRERVMLVSGREAWVYRAIG